MSVAIRPAGRRSRVLLVAEGDPAPAEVIGAELDPDLVPDQDADVELAHLARGVGENVLPSLQLHLEHGVRQGLDHGGVHLDGLLLDRLLDRAVGAVPPAGGGTAPGGAGSKRASRQGFSSIVLGTDQPDRPELLRVARPLSPVPPRERRRRSPRPRWITRTSLQPPPTFRL